MLLLGMVGALGGIPPVPAAPQPNAAAPKSGPPPTEADSATESWQVIYLGKSRIGFSRSLSRPVTLHGGSLQKTETMMRLSLKRFGQTLKMETRQETEERLDGDLVSFVFELKNPPAAATLTTGRVQGGRLAGEMNVGGTVRDYSQPIEPGTKSPAFLDRLLRERPPRPGDILAYKVFLPEQMRASDVRLTAGRRESVTLLDGRRRPLLKLAVLQSILPQSPVQLYLDDRGNALVSTTELLGQTLTMHTVPAAEALKDLAGEELDVSISTLVKSAVISDAHRTKRAVYRITMRGEDPTPYFPNYPNQKVIRRGVDTCEIVVSAVPPEMSHRSVRVDRQYLAGSRYLQTSDPGVLLHVDRAARNLTNPAAIAVAMEKYVNQQLQRKDFSTALGSAAEVAKSLQGDCTEHAVLLAAMLRARNIPSRIAVGLVYIEPLAAFGGHMWTEALLGDRWVPLDATLGRGGAGAAHIKLAESSFADTGPSPMATFLPLLRVLGRIELTVVETSLR